MQAARRKTRRLQRGQALLLGLIGIFLLAIGMYTTYNLSRTVYEKIKLQNAADATAYSLATMEARAFNFMAFTNRAQIAGYVQMMEAQSLLSESTFMEGVTAKAGDTMLAWSKVFIWKPEAHALLKSIGNGLKNSYRFWKKQVDLMEKLVPAYQTVQAVKNNLLFVEAAALFALTAAQVAEGGEPLAIENDENARHNTLSVALNIVNVASFANAIDWASLMLGPDSGEKTVAAKRVMTELANASRYAASGAGPHKIASRQASDAIASVIGAVTDATDNGGKVADLILKKLKPFMDLVFGLHGGFVGTTKMMAGKGSSVDIDETGSNAEGHSYLAAGEALVAKDIGLSMWGDFASVVSRPDGGRHCRYQGMPPDYGGILRVGSFWTRSELECKEETKHTWRGLGDGIGPYFKFNARKRGLVQATGHTFNQPDVWIFLNKRPDRMAPKGRGDLTFELKAHKETAQFDARIGQDGFFGSEELRGVNALSRAQVYYHRPGAWQEPPNLFNPFWGAKLAPKNAVISSIGDTLGLGGTLSQLVADNVWMF